MILKGIYKQLVEQDVMASNLKLYYLIRNHLIIMLHHLLEANVCVVMCVQNFAAVTIVKVMSCSLVKVQKQCYSTK